MNIYLHINKGLGVYISILNNDLCVFVFPYREDVVGRNDLVELDSWVQTLPQSEQVIMNKSEAKSVCDVVCLSVRLSV